MIGLSPRREPPSPALAPVRIETIELASPLPAIPARDPGDETIYAAVLCLVRREGVPVGVVELELPPRGLSPAALADALRRELPATTAADPSPDETRSAAAAGEIRVSNGRPGPDANEPALRDAPPTSVIVCTRAHPHSARRTVRSVLAADPPRAGLEVVVVDNASPGEPRFELPADLTDGAAVRVVHEPVPGLSHARNAGLRAASGEIVVFADDDVIVDRDWLARLLAPFAGDPTVTATSGSTLPLALEHPVERWTESFGARREVFEPRVFDLAAPPLDRPLFPFTVGELGAGRNMAFRRRALIELGGFDPALGPGTPAHDGDDIEALLRVVLSGGRVVHDPRAIVRHAHPTGYRELADRVWGYGIGLTAALTRAVLDRPTLLWTLLRKLPRGIAFALSPRSAKNVGRAADFPKRLAALELAGMAYGPLAYLRSRRAAVRARSAAGGGSARILMVSDEYPPYIGGAGVCMRLFAIELARRGHAVAIATAWHPDAPSYELDEGVEVHRIRDLPSRMRWISEDRNRHTPPPFPDPEAVWRLRRLIRRFSPDVVPAYGWLAHSAAAALLGKRIPMILWGHEYGNTCAVRTLVRKDTICSGPAPLKCLACSTGARGNAKGVVAVASLWASRPLLRRKTVAIHGVSGFVTEVMRRDLGIPDVPATTIPNFHAGRERTPDPKVLAKLPDRPFILFVGAFRRVKGVPELLAAYRSLPDPPPLVMVGIRTPDTPDRFPGGITVIGNAPHATVLAMWERALFGVFPSTWAEPLATVVHEAMSRGRPVIATRAGGHVDMVEHGRTGFLVPPRDPDALAAAMARLIADAGLRQRLGARARESARRFTRDEVVPELESFYASVVAGTRSATG